jgi:hypothetical protein
MDGRSPTLEAEWSLLRAACSANPETAIELARSLIPAIHWNDLLQLAQRHGVLPLLYKALACAGDFAPQAEMRGLAQSYQANLHKTLFLAREFIRIADHLEASGVEYLPYKGLTLAEAVYGDIALRQSGDIDFLIRPQSLPHIREAVRGLGYVPHTSLSELEEQAYLKSGYECAFDCEAGRNLLEVQWAIQPRFYAVDYSMKGVFERAVPATVAGRTVKTPCLDDQFIILSLHAAKHVWGRLIWLCDLARIASSPALNWNWIGSEARKLGIVRTLRVSLLLVQSLLGAVIPDKAEANLPEASKATVLAEEIEKKIVGDSRYDVESFEYFRLMLRLRERQSDRMRFLARLLFTPGPGEWTAVRLPEPLFPLYRLVRISRLAARVVSG